MAEISIISTTLVGQVSTKEPTTRIELTPWELQFLPHGPIQKGLLFRKPTPPPQENSVIDHLKTSLSHTLDLFYPLAGRLGTTVNDDNTTYFFINCNGAGAQFVHAAADCVTVADILESVYVPRIVHSFFPLNGVRNSEGVSQPLLGVQVTELVDGIFIGCTINHSIADGASFWHFFNSWSEISRSSNEITLSPVLDRWFVDDARYPIPNPQSMLVFTRPPSPPLQERVFHFTKEKVAALKAIVNAEIGTNQNSSLQALLALLWRSVTRSRRFPEDQESWYAFLIGMRPRMRPPLPQQYFGAAAQSGILKMKAGELLECGLGHAAWQMNKMFAAYTALEATNFLESWMKNPQPLSDINLIINNSLFASSSPRFNVYGTDFGWGRPIAVRSGGGNKLYGKTTLFQGADEGSIDIEACLFPETFEAMMEDAEFMEAVTV
ncbi:hypothetical protein AAG906_023983 [Vitis piasezkii]